MNKKIETLTLIAKELNKHNITWGIGGSLLLYFKGITDFFQDIDITVSEEDVEKTKNILLSLGTLHPKNPNAQYKTKYFLEFSINSVDLDVMAGFTIVHDNKDHYFPFNKDSIAEYLTYNDIVLPLQSVNDWLIYYKLMNRDKKVKLIESFQLKNI